MLFSDGSVNTKLKLGYGAYLLVSAPDVSLETLKNQVKIKCFEDTSSTKLELETLLWALNDMAIHDCKLLIYTDSQNIMTLPDRRKRMEENEYRTKKNTLIKNHQLYKAFFKLNDKLDFQLHKIKGHKASRLKSNIDDYFTIVDRASRSALRKHCTQ